MNSLGNERKPIGLKITPVSKLVGSFDSFKNTVKTSLQFPVSISLQASPIVDQSLKRLPVAEKKKHDAVIEIDIFDVYLAAPSYAYIQFEFGPYKNKDGGVSNPPNVTFRFRGKERLVNVSQSTPAADGTVIVSPTVLENSTTGSQLNIERVPTQERNAWKVRFSPSSQRDRYIAPLKSVIICVVPGPIQTNEDGSVVDIRTSSLRGIVVRGTR